jgi:26S proteasome regulatory subunit N12
MSAREPIRVRLLVKRSRVTFVLWLLRLGRGGERMSNQSSDLPALVESIQRNFKSNLFTNLPPLLARAKVLLVTQHLLPLNPSQGDRSQLELARTVFEIGAYTSIRLKDKAAFVNYLGYLKEFYSLGLGAEKESDLTGLNLLRLLAENKIAEFHTQLEIIDVTASHVASSEPVQFARGLEEWVMEGAYNRVWKAGEGQGVNVYQKFFLDVLMDTIRNEIATCLERAYPSLPVSDTQILLFFPPQDSGGFGNFAQAV